MTNKKEIKCKRCAELSGCWKGQNGGKPCCKCFSPKAKQTGGNACSFFVLFFQRRASHRFAPNFILYHPAKDLSRGF